MPSDYVDIKYAELQNANALHDALTPATNSTDAVASLEEDVRTVQGTVNAGAYGGMYFTASTVSSWLKNGNKGTFLVTMDVLDETEQEDSYVEIDVTNAVASAVTDMARRSLKKQEWCHVSTLVTQTESVAWSVDLRCHGLTSGDTFKFSFKNFQVYEMGVSGVPYTDLAGVIMTPGVGVFRNGNYLGVDLANISQAAAGTAGKVITAGILHQMANSNSLYKMGNNVEVVDRVIGPKKASVSDILGGTANLTGIVTNGALNGAINLGRAVDVTSAALYTTLAPASGYDLRGTYTVSASSVASGTKVYYGFVSSPTDTPFPKYAAGLKYLFIVEVKNTSSVTLAGLGFDGEVSAVGELPITQTNVTANGEYVRLACVTTTPYVSLAAWQTTGAAANISASVKTWRQFEVTALSDEAIAALASMSNIDDVFAKYLIKTDAVCPWINVIGMGTAPSVTIGAGLSYKLFAMEGTHTLTTDNVVANSYGRDAHIELYVGDAGSVQVQAPLQLMDPLTPNAVNNCTVKFRNGEARLYVDDIDAGYVISVATGTGDNTLYLGVTRSIEEGTVEYLTFSHVLDGVPVVLTVDSSSISWTKPINLLGNGKEDTLVDLNNGSVAVADHVNLYKLAISNGTITPAATGIVTVTDCVFNADATATSGVIEFTGSNEFNGTVTGSSVTIANGCSLTGSGTFTSGTINMGNANMNGLTFDHGWVVATTAGATTMLTSCTINNGTTSQNGAGVAYVNNKGSVVDCVISGCSAAGHGGGVFLASNTTTPNVISNTVVANNIANTNGGGIAIHAGNSALVQDTVISGNTATHGGAIGCYNARTTMSGCTVTANVGLQGVAMAHDGGTLTMSDCLISGNTATSYDTVFAQHSGTVILSGCSVVNNKAGVDGAGVVTHIGGSATLNRCTIASNVSPIGPGVETGSNGTLNVNSCLISGNTATNYGAGVCGYLNGGKLYLTGTTVTANVASFGGAGMYVNGSGCSADLIDCIFDTSQDIKAISSATITMGGSNVLKSTLTNNGLTSIGSGAIVDLTGNSNQTVMSGGSITFAPGGATVITSNGTSYMLGGVTIPCIRNDRVVDLKGSTAFRIGTPGLNCSVSGATITNGRRNYGASLECINGTMYVTDCLIAGNSCSTAQIFLSYKGQLHLTGCTVTSTNYSYSTIDIENGGNLYLSNCIIEPTSHTAIQGIVFGNLHAENKLYLLGSNHLLCDIRDNYGAGSGTVVISSGAIVDLTGNTNTTPINPGGGVTFLPGGATVYPSAGSASAYVIGGMTLPGLGKTNVVDLQETHIPVSTSAVVTGVTFSNGKVDGGEDIQGGAFSLGGSPKTFTSCTFISNSILGDWAGGKFGGAIYAFTSNTVFSNCIFSSNSASQYGGAIGLRWNAVVTLTGCTFTDNKALNADRGNAIWLHGNSTDAVTLNISNCVFNANQTLTFYKTSTTGQQHSIVLSGRIKTLSVIKGIWGDTSTSVTLLDNIVLDFTGNTNTTPVIPGGNITVNNNCTVITVAGATVSLPAGVYKSINNDGTTTT